MSAITEPDRLGDLLKFEEDNLYSRDKVIVASGQNLVAGTVIASLDAGGKIVALDSGGGGSDKPIGIIGQDVDASGGDIKSWIIARHAIVAESQVIWPGGANANDIAADTKTLKGLGILLRKDA